MKKKFFRTYKSWTSAIQRCHNPNDSNFAVYGARGISVCEEWRNSFEAFLEHMGERPEGTTLDRWPNGQGNYEPGNCRWATKREQTINRSSVHMVEWNGSLLCLSEVSRISGLSYDTVRAAYHRGDLTPDLVNRIATRKHTVLSPEQILEIRSLKGVIGQIPLAKRYGVHKSYIGRIQNFQIRCEVKSPIAETERGTSDEPCPAVVD